jgi:hypothetical protein
MTQTSQSDPRHWHSVEVAPLSSDGKHYIAIHPKARTELGRLIHCNAVTPFSVHGMDNPDYEGGAWKTYADAARTIASDWVNDRSIPNGRTMRKLEMWLRWKIDQNVYIRDLLKNSQTTVFLYAEDDLVDIDGVLHYSRSANNVWFEQSLVKLRRSIREHDERVTKAMEKSRQR